MKRVLVTGGAGFIGCNLVRALLGRGCSVAVVDDLSSGELRNLAGIGPGLTFIEAPVASIRAHLASVGKVDCVFHLAALISGYESLSNPRAYFDVNVGGLLSVVDVCPELGHPRLVFASSSTVYGDGRDACRSEDTATAPSTTYAVTKLTGEHLLDVFRTRNGFDDVSLRLFNVYGPYQRPNHPYANVTCKYAFAAARGEGVVLYGDGTQTRDFIFIDDVVEILLRVAERSTAHRIYNVGTGVESSVLQLLELVRTLSQKPVAVTQAEAWPNDIRAIRADISRLEREFGWKPRVSLEEGLRRTIEHFRVEALER